jgi:hypothetical protein
MAGIIPATFYDSSSVAQKGGAILAVNVKRYPKTLSRIRSLNAYVNVLALTVMVQLETRHLVSCDGTGPYRDFDFTCG